MNDSKLKDEFLDKMDKLFLKYDKAINLTEKKNKKLIAEVERLKSTPCQCERVEVVKGAGISVICKCCGKNHGEFKDHTDYLENYKGVNKNVVNNRYALFAGMTYDSDGGAGDFVKFFESEGEAQEYFNDNFNSIIELKAALWSHVVDASNMHITSKGGVNYNQNNEPKLIEWTVG